MPPQHANQWVNKPNYNLIIMQQRLLEREQEEIEERQQRENELLNDLRNQRQIMLNNPLNQTIEQQQNGAVAPENNQQNADQVPDQELLQQFLNDLRTQTGTPSAQQERLRNEISNNPMLFPPIIIRTRRQFFEMQNLPVPQDTDQPQSNV